MPLVVQLRGLGGESDFRQDAEVVRHPLITVLGLECTVKDKSRIVNSPASCALVLQEDVVHTRKEGAGITFFELAWGEATGRGSRTFVDMAECVRPSLRDLADLGRILERVEITRKNGRMRRQSGDKRLKRGGLLCIVARVQSG